MVGYWLPIGVGRVHHSYPDFPLRTLLSHGQIESKAWLLQQSLALGWTDLGVVYLCAGWVGSLAAMIFDEPKFQVERVFCFDIDEESTHIAEVLNRPFVIDFHKFKAFKLDILELKYQKDIILLPNEDWKLLPHEITPSIVINTSCEHIAEFSKWWDLIPSGTRVVLQSNNETQYSGHVNCVQSLDEFKAAAPMQNLLFAGERKVSHYTRYMLMGFK